MRTDATSLADFRFSADHYWFHLRDSVWTVGLTDFAQKTLSDIVYIRLPLPGAWFERGDPIGEIESLKSSADLEAPFPCTVVEINHEVEEDPQLINEDPYGGGWLLKVEPDRVEDLTELLDYRGYLALVEE
jgi:glycine cleavage system H protein